MRVWPAADVTDTQSLSLKPCFDAALRLGKPFATPRHRSKLDSSVAPMFLIRSHVQERALDDRELEQALARDVADEDAYDRLAREYPD